MVVSNPIPVSNALSVSNHVPVSNAMGVSNHVPVNVSNALGVSNPGPVSSAMGVSNPVPVSNALGVSNAAPVSNAMGVSNAAPVRISNLLSISQLVIGSMAQLHVQPHARAKHVGISFLHNLNHGLEAGETKCRGKTCGNSNHA